MRHITQAGIDLIKKFEGFSPTTYLCPAGKPTIGYGHLIQEGESFREPITPLFGEKLLRADVQKAERAVERLVTVPLTDGQFDALVSFTYNLGTGALQRSTLLGLVNEQNHEAAAKEFKRWVYAGGRKLRGLVRRRKAERNLYKGR